MKSKVLLIACIALSLSLGARAQKSNADYIEDLKTAGYPVIQPLSFAITKQKLAMTALYKSKDDKNALMHSVEISANKDGASIFFRVYRPCVPSENANRLQERIIMISGQKIEAYYYCGFGSADSQTNEVYRIKSTAGNDFAKKAFAEMNYVFVHLNDLPVPFHTEGFSKAMAESSGKAL
jgi:hypothetical protein